MVHVEQVSIPWLVVDPSGCTVNVYVSMAVPLTPPEKATTSTALKVKLPSAARRSVCVWFWKGTTPVACTWVGGLAHTAGESPRKSAKKAVATQNSLRMI